MSLELGKFVNIKKKMRENTSYILLAVLTAFWVVAIATSPYFRSVEIFDRILIKAVPIALVGLSQTYIVLTGNFDMSVGAMVSVSTAIASVSMGWNIGIAIAIILLFAFIIGAANGIGVSKLGINPFILTLGTMFVLQGVALYLRPSPGGFIPKLFLNVVQFQFFGISLFYLLVILVIGTLAIVTLQRRKLGRHIYATGGDPESAKLAGVNVDRILIKVFIISAVFAAVAGLFVAARIGSGDAYVGNPYLFDSFIVVFMGGTLIKGGRGRYASTLFAAFILATLFHYLVFMGVSIWYQYIVRAGLLVGVVSLQTLIRGRRVEE